MGHSSSMNMELEWPIDTRIALIWVVFGINMIGDKKKRTSFICCDMVLFGQFRYCSGLHIFNSLSIPVSPMKSSVYAGVQDALVQWW
jgi:cbb3-type cytochrome oxidase subunit 1